MRRFVPVLALISFFPLGGLVWAQSEKGPTVAPHVLPGPFVEEEKSPFLKGLRRFEIIAFGSFPITLFYANLGFDISRYVNSGYNSYYVPWPFNTEYSYHPTDREILSTIGTAALLSIGVGAVDAIIRAIRFRKASEGSSRVDSP